MMTRKAFRWLAALLSVAVVVILLSPATRTAVIALLRGETSYRGIPSSSWSKTIREGPVPFSPPGHIVSVDFDSRVPASPLDGVKKSLGLQYTVTVAYYPLREDDAAAIPVLIELLQDEHSIVRMYSAETLGAFGARAEVAIPALRTLITDEEFGAFAISVGERAMEAIARIQSDIRKNKKPGRHGTLPKPNQALHRSGASSSVVRLQPRIRRCSTSDRHDGFSKDEARCSRPAC
jgi:hypothetical protein